MAFHVNHPINRFEKNFCPLVGFEGIMTTQENAFKTSNFNEKLLIKHTVATYMKIRKGSSC